MKRKFSVWTYFFMKFYSTAEKQFWWELTKSLGRQPNYSNRYALRPRNDLLKQRFVIHPNPNRLREKETEINKLKEQYEGEINNLRAVVRQKQRQLELMIGDNRWDIGFSRDMVKSFADAVYVMSFNSSSFCRLILKYLLVSSVPQERWQRTGKSLEDSSRW